MYKCACMKCDLNGESDCEFAKLDPVFGTLFAHILVSVRSLPLSKRQLPPVSAQKKNWRSTEMRLGHSLKTAEKLSRQ